MTNFADRIFVCFGFGAGGPELQLANADSRTARTESEKSRLNLIGMATALTEGREKVDRTIKSFRKKSKC